MARVIEISGDPFGGKESDEEDDQPSGNESDAGELSQGGLLD